MKDAVILLSGGQDSTTCLFWALKRFNTVRAIGFAYGQKHEKELLYASKIAKNAGISYDVLNIEGLLQGSSLIDHSLDHNSGDSLPASFVTSRNLIFLSIASNYAAYHKIHDLVTGVCQTDYSGYPDCRRDFIDSLEKTLKLATDQTFRIHTPLMYLSKAETWKLAKDLGCIDIIRTQTLTDYNGDVTENEWGLGQPDNPASILRKRGYEEAKMRGWV